MIFCKQCGKQLNTGAKFCGGCGAAQSAPAAGAGQTPFQQPVQKPGNVKRNVIIGVATGLVVVLALVFLLRSPSGYLIITGIPAEHNGRFAFFLDELAFDGDTYYIAGFLSFNQAANAYTLPQISGGRVEIPLWDGFFGEYVRFFDNEIIDGYLFIMNEQSHGMGQYDGILASVFFSNIELVNGRATVPWGAGQ